MKKVLKIIIPTVCVIAIAITGVFAPYVLSFVFKDDELSIAEKSAQAMQITDVPSAYPLSKDDKGFGMFNYYGLKYTADAYVKGTLTYKTGTTEVSLL